MKKDYESGLIQVISQMSLNPERRAPGRGDIVGLPQRGWPWTTIVVQGHPRARTGHGNGSAPGWAQRLATKTCAAICVRSSAASPPLPTITPPGNDVTLTTAPGCTPACRRRYISWGSV